ncbi:MAG: tetratricopeptide repeat protein [Acidobacteria bacterium]|nr:tetratricopeptide repeat protein [Acidobacteriota bacterium]
MGKRKKHKKTPHPIIQDPAAVRRLAEEHLRLGRLDDAIHLLTRHVEGKSGPDPALRQMLAQAHYQRALRSTSPTRTDLERAATYDAEQPRYRLALALANLASGRAEDVGVWLESSPDEKLTHLSRALQLLAARRTREFKGLQQRLPAEVANDAALVRLQILRHLLVGNAQLAEPLLTALDPLDRGLYEGIIRWMSGDEAGALASLSEIPALERNPTPEEAQLLATQFFFLGVRRARAGQLAGARTAWREAQRLALEHELALPWVKRLAAHWQALAAAALAQRDLETALVCFEQALAIEPENKVIASNLRAVRLAQANRLSQQGQLDRAVELWRACAASGLQNEAVLKNLAVACEKLNRMEEAAELWRQLARLWRRQAQDTPADPSLKGQLARLERHAADLMLKIGRPPYEIIDELEAALKIDPSQHEVRRVLADVLLEIGQTQKAVRHLEMIQKQQGTTPQLLAQIGAAYEMAGRSGDARRCYERALELDPKFVPAQRMLLQWMGSRAVDAEHRGDHRQAIEICHRQLEIDPTYTPALSHLAMLHFHRGHKKEAEQMLQRILDIDPNNPNNRGIVGSMYLAMREKKKAKEQFDKAIELDPSELCFFNVGSSYLAHADLKKALAHFDRAIAVGSVDTILDVISALLDYGYIPEAQNYLNMALEREPERPDVYLMKANLLVEQMRLKEAKEVLAQAEALAANPKYADVRAEIRSLRQFIRDTEEMGRVIGLGDLRDLPPLPPDVLRLFKGK